MAPALVPPLRLTPLLVDEPPGGRHDFRQELAHKLRDLEVFVQSEISRHSASLPQASHTALGCPLCASCASFNDAGASTIVNASEAFPPQKAQSVEFSPQITDATRKSGGSVTWGDLEVSAADHEGSGCGSRNTHEPCLDDDVGSEGHMMNNRGSYKLDKIVAAMKDADLYRTPSISRKQRSWLKLPLPETQAALSGSISGIVIILNALTIGLSTDIEPDWDGWQVMDFCFAGFFLMEMLVKMWFSGLRDYFCGAEWMWNRFEVLTVLLSWVEVGVQFVAEDTGSDTSGLALVRILRFVRITRLLRVARLQIFTDLMIMIKGALGGAKTLCWASILICFCVYFFAVVFRLGLGNQAELGGGAENFVDLQTSFYTMFRCMVSKECTDTSGRPIFALVARNHNWMYTVMYCSVDMVMTFGLFNVIVAIFIENVLARAKTNEELIKRKRLSNEKYFADKMTEFVAEIIDCKEAVEGRCGIGTRPSARGIVESAADIQITPEIFQEVRSRPKAMDILRDLDVSDEDSMNMFETLDADGSGTLDMPELLKGIEKLRGSATRSDIVGITLMLQKVQEGVQLQKDLQDRTWQVVRSLGKNQGMSTPIEFSPRMKGMSSRSSSINVIRHSTEGGSGLLHHCDSREKGIMNMGGSPMVFGNLESPSLVSTAASPTLGGSTVSLPVMQPPTAQNVPLTSRLETSPQRTHSSLTAGNSGANRANFNSNGFYSPKRHLKRGASQKSLPQSEGSATGSRALWKSGGADTAGSLPDVRLKVDTDEDTEDDDQASGNDSTTELVEGSSHI